MGRSRDGLTIKLAAIVDALRNLKGFVLLPGQRHDAIGVPPLIKGVASCARPNLIACRFSKLKHFRRVAARFEKTARNHLAVTTLAATMLRLR